MENDEMENRVVDLLCKRLRNELTEAEAAELTAYEESDALKQFTARFSTDYLEQRLKDYNRIDTDNAWQQFRTQSPLLRRNRVMIMFRRLAAAAVLGVVIFLGVYHYGFKGGREKQSLVAGSITGDSILYPPAGNKVLLTLANGEELAIDLASNGVIAEQGGSEVSKSGDELHYNSAQNGGQALTNIITTPKGSNYRLVLTDGSKLILNESSKLRFPTAFNGSSRDIELLEGELFLEVAKDVSKPFVVTAKGIQTKVLGTSFNIKALRDERGINATLVSGAVQVNYNDQQVVLKPGQQVLPGKDGRFTVREVDTYAITAWTRDRFYFDNTPLAEVMQVLAKWYDFKVILKDDLGGEMVSAVLARTSTANELFKDIEASCNVQMTVKNNEVLIQRKR